MRGAPLPSPLDSSSPVPRLGRSSARPSTSRRRDAAPEQWYRSTRDMRYTIERMREFEEVVDDIVISVQPLTHRRARRRCVAGHRRQALMRAATIPMGFPLAFLALALVVMAGICWWVAMAAWCAHRCGVSETHQSRIPGRSQPQHATAHLSHPLRGRARDMATPPASDENRRGGALGATGALGAPARCAPCYCGRLGRS